MKKTNNEAEKLSKADIKKYSIVKVYECEFCKKKPALWRWYIDKRLCNECAKPEFIKHLDKIIAGAVVLLLIGLTAIQYI